MDSARKLMFSTVNNVKDNEPVVSTATWEQLVPDLLHAVEGDKDGPALIPFFINGRRSNENAFSCDLMVFDLDSGQAFDDVQVALKAAAREAVLYTSFSHMTTETEVSRTLLCRDGLSPQEALEKKGILREIAMHAARGQHRTRKRFITRRGERLVEEQQTVMIQHPAISKLRVVIPLAKKFRVKDYKDVDTAQAVWREFCLRVADTLGLEVDIATFDLARMFYTPRVPRERQKYFQSARVAGDPLDIDLVLPPEDRENIKVATPGGHTNQFIQRARQDRAAYTGADIPDTAVKRWLAKIKPDLRDLIKRTGWPVLGEAADKLHLLCPFEDGHSAPQPEGDTSCSVVGNSISCLHNHCQGRDRIEFISRAIDHGWLTGADAPELWAHAENNADPECEPATLHGEYLPASTDWKAGLLRNRDKAPVACERNIRLVLENDPNFTELVALDVLSDKLMLMRKPPHSRSISKRYPVEWRDEDDTGLAAELQGIYFNARPGMVHDTVKRIAFDARYNPLTDSLDTFVWDQTPRIDTWLTEYFGVKDTPLHRAFGRKFLIGAIARAYEPGCKLDNMLIIEGKQGLQKSSAIRELALGYSGELTANIARDTGKAAEQLQGLWLVEKSELASMRGGDAETVKAFITRQSDRMRPAYGRRVLDFPRRVAFIGTTNDDSYLSDSTGNRRYWPVRATKVDMEGIARVREQLWAEAIVAYREGEPWWLDQELETAAGEVQAERLGEDVYLSDITAYIDKHNYVAVTVPQLFDEVNSLAVRRGDKGVQHRVSDALKRLGFVNTKKRCPLQSGRPNLWVHRDELARLGIRDVSQLQPSHMDPHGSRDSRIINIWSDLGLHN